MAPRTQPRKAVKKKPVRQSRRIRGKSPVPATCTCNSFKKHIKNCPACAKRIRNDKRANRSPNQAANPWCNFYAYICKRNRDLKLGMTQKEAMRKAGACWKLLTADQKKDFVAKSRNGSRSGSGDRRGTSGDRGGTSGDRGGSSGNGRGDSGGSSRNSVWDLGFSSENQSNHSDDRSNMPLYKAGFSSENQNAYGRPSPSNMPLYRTGFSFP